MSIGQSTTRWERLAHSFNEMQSKLEREESELKLAHSRATDIYDLTPSMLFSLDEADWITAVSDYWLTATGYARTASSGVSLPISSTNTGTKPIGRSPPQRQHHPCQYLRSHCQVHQGERRNDDVLILE
jgi:hypothetical protein